MSFNARSVTRTFGGLSLTDTMHPTVHLYVSFELGHANVSRTDAFDEIAVGWVKEKGDWQ